ncbi:MAG TPA: FtsX-like permease family protein, partial [Streptosporangiaceae bacterium]
MTATAAGPGSRPPENSGRAGLAPAARRLGEGWVWATGTGGAVSAGLALLVFACVFMAVAGTRAALGLRTQALQRAVAATPAPGRGVSGSIDYSGFITLLPSGFNQAGIDQAERSLLGYLRADRLPLAPAGQDWAGMFTQLQPVAGAATKATLGQPPRLELVYRDKLSRYSRLVTGRLPASSQAGPLASRFQIAVTEATATRLGLRVGSRLRTGTGTTLVVSGIVRPLDAASAFWTADRSVLAPAVQSSGGDSPQFLAGAALVGAGELRDVARAYPIANIGMTWLFPLQLSRVTAAQAAGLQAALTKMQTHEAQVTFRGEAAEVEPVSLTSGIGSQLDVFLQQDLAVSSVLYSLFASLAVVAGLAVLLCCWLLAEHRRAEFSVLRARGASAAQHARLAFRAAATATLPGAAAGAVAAVLVTPGHAALTGYWLAGLVVLAGLVTPPLIALRWRRTASRGAARSRGAAWGWRTLARQAAIRRVLIELGLLAAAAGGLALLRRQGTTAGHEDWYTSLAPTLVAIPAAIVVLRCYPLALRGLQRLTAVRPGVAAFVGVARAARTSLRAALPVFALVLTMAVVAFGAAVHSAVQRGEIAASWHRVGADAIIGLPQDLATLDPQDSQIAAAPGVRHTAAISIQAGATARGFGLTVVIVSPAQYAALIADTPGQPFPAGLLRQPPGGASGGAVPVLVSAKAAPLIQPGASRLEMGVHSISIRAAGRAPLVPGVTARSLLIMPSWAFGPHPPQPTLLLLTGSHINRPALIAVIHHVLPSATITLRSAALAALANAPLSRAGVLAFAAGAIAAAILASVVLLVTLLLGARSRELTVTRLRVIGLAPRQARWLTATEGLPQVAAAALAGVAAAFVLTVLLGPALNLSPFTGSTVNVPLRVSPAALAGAAAALLIIALLALLAE